MKLVQLVRCAFGYHERDRSTVVIGKHHHHGRCRGCGAAMVKNIEGWRLERRHA